MCGVTSASVPVSVPLTGVGSSAPPSSYTRKPVWAASATAASCENMQEAIYRDMHKFAMQTSVLPVKAAEKEAAENIA